MGSCFAKQETQPKLFFFFIKSNRYWDVKKIPTYCRGQVKRMITRNRRCGLEDSMPWCGNLEGEISPSLTYGKGANERDVRLYCVVLQAASLEKANGPLLPFFFSSRVTWECTRTVDVSFCIWFVGANIVTSWIMTDLVLWHAKLDVPTPGHRWN